jgi:hypothetical protein
VKLESNGQAQIGWCTDDYDGTNNKVSFLSFLCFFFESEILIG